MISQLQKTKRDTAPGKRKTSPDERANAMQTDPTYVAPVQPPQPNATASPTNAAQTNRNGRDAAQTNGIDHNRFGHRIVFIRGKCNGKEGWLDTEKGKTAKCVYVFVDLRNEDGSIKPTLVKKKSVKKKRQEAAAQVEDQVLNANPRVEYLMRNLATELARSGLEQSEYIYALLFEMAGAEKEELRLFYPNAVAVRTEVERRAAIKRAAVEQQTNGQG